MHQIGQWRDAADHMAGRVLRICADKIEDREKEGRRKAVGEERKMDVQGVLRSLAKLEQ